MDINFERRMDVVHVTSEEVAYLISEDKVETVEEDKSDAITELDGYENEDDNKEKEGDALVELLFVLLRSTK